MAVDRLPDLLSTEPAKGHREKKIYTAHEKLSRAH